jgi:hypothetical protein
MMDKARRAQGQMKIYEFSLWARDRDHRTGMLYMDVKHAVEQLGIFEIVW